MAKLASFLDYYYETMRGQLAPLEEERLRIVDTLKKTIFFIVLGTIVLFIILSKTVFSQDFFAALGISVGAGFLIYQFIYRNQISGFKTLFKDQIIEKMVQFIDESLRYNRYGSITKGEYQASHLFAKSYDRFRGDDLVVGDVDGVSLKFSDLHTEYKSKDKDNKEHWHTIFQGIFFIADFHKNFKGRTVVLPDRAEKLFGGFGQFFQGMSSHGELVKMDDPTFEKEFVVYSDDQIEARYILSPALMERITKLKKKSGKALQVSFNGSKIYVAISYQKEMFEPKIFKSLLDFNEMREYFEVLEMITGIVKEFKLNRKIWTKK